MIAPARVAAFHALVAVSSGRADLPAAIAHARSALEDDRDRGLAAEIATGVQRWRGQLDALIERASNRTLDRLDPEVVEILRLGLYQLLHLTRVPASAIVDDAVELTRKAGKRSAAGFVNAVLRKISRSRGALPLPARPIDPLDRTGALDYLSTTQSHPRWLAARWYDRVGLDAAEQWMAFNNSPAPLTLRANRLRMTAEDVAAGLRERDVVVRRARYAPDGLIVGRGQPLRDPGTETGWFVVQDEASQLVALLASPEPGSKVLDACASPGGKTTALAAAVGASGLVVACDVRSRRIGLLKRTVHACGAMNVAIVQADLLSPLPFGPSFDRVLVDAPCSGLGTLRRDPDIKWKRQEADLPTLAVNQLRMLHNASRAVAAGGSLIYSTCSSEPDENEQVVAAFLSTATGFAPLNASGIAGVPPIVVNGAGYLRTMPHVHGLEAFFGAVLRKL